MFDTNRVDQVLARAIDEGVAPGVVALAALDEEGGDLRCRVATCRAGTNSPRRPPERISSGVGCDPGSGRVRRCWHTSRSTAMPSDDTAPSADPHVRICVRYLER